jgi:hypothetical protein
MMEVPPVRTDGGTIGGANTFATLDYRPNGGRYHHENTEGSASCSYCSIISQFVGSSPNFM